MGLTGEPLLAPLELADEGCLIAVAPLTLDQFVVFPFLRFHFEAFTIRMAIVGGKLAGLGRCPLFKN